MVDGMIIQKIFEKSVEHFPFNVAIEEKKRSITYHKLKALSDYIKERLIAFGVDDNDVVGIYLDASIKYVATVLGVLKAGGIFMPINTGFPKERILQVISQTKPVVLITDGNLEIELSKILEGYTKDFKIIALTNNINSRAQASQLKKRNQKISGPLENIFKDSIKDDKGCYIFTTSGSTGTPKAILGCHHGISHFIKWSIKEFKLDATMRVGLIPHVTFDASLYDIFSPLYTGGTICIPDKNVRFNLKRLLEWIKINKITFIHMVPTMFRMLIKAAEQNELSKVYLKSLRWVMLAGEPLYSDDIQKWYRFVDSEAILTNFYGPTETTLTKTFYRIIKVSKSNNEIIPIGKPIPDTEILIVNNGKTCAVNEKGEIYIKTPFMTAGYYNDPKRTEEVFVPNPVSLDRNDLVYKTGDYGMIMPDGNLCFLGRIDDQIKINGIRIEIGEIESVLSKHEKICQAVVTAKKDLLGNYRLAAYFDTFNGTQIDKNVVRDYLKQKLPNYMVPSQLFFLEKIPTTHSGKIDRRALPDLQSIKSKNEYHPPVTKMESALSKIWSKVLGLERVGTNYIFFDYGGTSLASMQVIMLIQTELGIDLPIVKMFEYPNIKLLGCYLENQSESNPSIFQIKNRAKMRKAAYIKRRQKG